MPLSARADVSVSRVMHRTSVAAAVSVSGMLLAEGEGAVEGKVFLEGKTVIEGRCMCVCVYVCMNNRHNYTPYTN
jgi:hypothetical protein